MTCIHDNAWPALAYADWADTCNTLHLWTQVVGKVKLALAPLSNHWWGIVLLSRRAGSPPARCRIAIACCRSISISAPKLADLTAKFAAHPTTKNGKAKKAQVQRVAHATAHLDKCLAAQTS